MRRQPRALVDVRHLRREHQRAVLASHRCGCDPTQQYDHETAVQQEPRDEPQHVVSAARRDQLRRHRLRCRLQAHQRQTLRRRQAPHGRQGPCEQRPQPAWRLLVARPERPVSRHPGPEHPSHQRQQGIEDLPLGRLHLLAHAHPERLLRPSDQHPRGVRLIVPHLDQRLRRIIEVLADEVKWFVKGCRTYGKMLSL